MDIQHHMVCWILHTINSKQTRGTADARLIMAGLETTLITIPQGWHPLLELALIITIGVTFG